MYIRRFPIRIVARIKRPPIDVELVRKHELERLAGCVRLLGIGRLGGINVDQATVARDRRELTRCIDTPKVKTPLCRLLVGQKMARERITCNTMRKYAVA